MMDRNEVRKIVRMDAAVQMVTHLTECTMCQTSIINVIREGLDIDAAFCDTGIAIMQRIEALQEL